MKNLITAALLALLVSGCSFFSVEPYREVRKFDPPRPAEAALLAMPEPEVVRNLTPAGVKLLFRRGAAQVENPYEQWAQPPESMLRRYLLNRRDPAQALPGLLRLDIIGFELDIERQQAEVALDAVYGQTRRSFRVTAPLTVFDGEAAAAAVGQCFEELARQIAAWSRTVKL